MSTTLSAGTATSGAALSSDTSGILQLQSGSTPTTAVTIDTAQNVGVGVTPSAWYTTSNTHAIQLPNSALLDYQGTSANYAQNAYLNTSGNWIYKTTAAATQYQQSGGAHYWYNVGSGTAGNTISFTQAMTLDSSGNLLVGNTSYVSTPSSGVTIQTGNNASVNVGHTSSPSGYLFVNFGYGGTQIGSITQNGTTAVAYNTTSDYRLKENVAPVTNGLATVTQLNPVSFDWVSDKSNDVGFLAHEFQSVIPRAVIGSKDAVDAEGKPVYQQMDNSGAIPYLVAAIKELSAEVTALKAKVGA